MSLTSILSYGFGFFAVPVVVAVFICCMLLITGYGSLFDMLGLNRADAWSGGFIFAAVAIIAGVIAARIFG